MELQVKKPLFIAEKESIEMIESCMLGMVQADCPVVHRFGPNICIREVILEKDLIVIGHEHKYDHMCIMLTGKIALINEDGTISVLEAPCQFNAKAGRKIAYIIETCVFQNIFATTEKDPQKIEEHFLNKSETWAASDNQIKAIKKAKKQIDRDDYDNFLFEFSLNKDEVKKISENKEDVIELPDEYRSIISVRESPIEGKGLFLSFPVKKGDLIAPARIYGKRTEAGRYVNHSKDPNCKYIVFNDGNIYLVADKNIKGSIGGSEGTELTVNYRQALGLSKYIEELKCQQ